MVSGMKTFGENVMRLPVFASRIARAAAIRSAREEEKSGALMWSSEGSGTTIACDLSRREGLVALPADEDLVERVAAALVHQDHRWLVAGEVLVAPPHERDERGRQIEAPRGEAVLVTQRPFAVG